MLIRDDAVKNFFDHTSSFSSMALSLVESTNIRYVAHMGITGLFSLKKQGIAPQPVFGYESLQYAVVKQRVAILIAMNNKSIIPPEVEGQ